MADRLARSVRKQPSFVVHMDADHPFWFTESVYVDDKKKQIVDYIKYWPPHG